MQQLGQLQASVAEFNAEDAQILAISVDAPNVSKGFKAQLGLTFPLLSDPKGEVIRAYDVLDPLLNISKPAVVVMDGSGAIRWKQVGEHKADLANLAALVQAVKEAKPDGTPRAVSAKGKRARIWADIKRNN